MSITEHKYGRLETTTIWICNITELTCVKTDDEDNPDCDYCIYPKERILPDVKKRRI